MILKMVDLIQHRYGWTDEVVFSLPYARFHDICELVMKLNKEENMERYRLSAYTAYLLKTPENTSFGSYLESLGLGYEEESEKAKLKKVSKEHSINKAYEILDKFGGK